MTAVPEPAFSDLATLGTALRSGQTTSLALTEFFLDRLDRLGRQWRAVAAIDPDGACEDARRADAAFAVGRDLGPLHGIPFAVKDIFASRPPLPTSWGAPPFRDRQLDFEAPVVSRLRQAGAVFLGKLAMMELAAMFPFETFDASATGTCLNPFDAGAWTGDSSSGPSAAVGGGLVPFAIASETRGSIIQPAAFCGAVGLRPTLGLVPTDGMMPVSQTVDRAGPMARRPADCLAVLNMIADRPVDGAIRIGRPHVGLISPDEARDDPEVAANYKLVAERISEFADTTTVTLPDLPFEEVYQDIVVFEAKRNFEPLIADGTVAQLASPLARHGGYLAMPGDEGRYRIALEHRADLIATWQAWSSQFDCLLTTTNPKVAPPVDTTFSDYFGDDDHEPITTIGAVLGLPAVTIPSGTGQRGLPTGVQFVGRPRDDARICAIAELAFTRLRRVLPPDANVA